MPQNHHSSFSVIFCFKPFCYYHNPNYPLLASRWRKGGTVFAMSMRKCRLLSKPESLILCICWYHLFLFKLLNILMCCIWFGWCVSQGSSETQSQWDIKREIYFKKCVHTIVGIGISKIERGGWKESQERVDIADWSLNLQGMPAGRTLRRAFYAAA